MADENSYITGLGQLSKDLEEADFGNLHLTKRYCKMIDSIMERPGNGFPGIFCNEASLEGAYRFLRNAAVTFDRTIQPHYKATIRRCQSYNEVIVIHDTTEFGFGGESPREGLGYINQTSGQGFFAHVAIAVTADSKRIPLGALGLSTISRLHRGLRGKKDQRDPNRESLRWKEMVEKVEQRLTGVTRTIHVMDSEADIFELIDDSILWNRDFVIRLHHNRVLTKETGFRKISDALEKATFFSEGEVIVSKRAKTTGTSSRPVREGRVARVKYTATTVEIKRPGRASLECSNNVVVNIVHANEVDPPEGVERVEWILLTSLDNRSKKQIIRIVDLYRARWLIEEFFKVIKTGCKYEQRQLESFHTLLNALALIIPVAHRLLLLRTMSRVEGWDPQQAVSTTQMKILEVLPDAKLPRNPTTRDVLLAIAKLGGHIKNNGAPGWIVLWRGYQTLLAYEVGWNAKK